MANVKFNIIRLRLNKGLIETCHSKDTSHVYTSNVDMNVAQFLDTFEFGDSRFDIPHYFDHATGQLHAGHTNGEVIATLWNGNTIRLYWDTTASYPYYYNGGFEFWWANNTMMGRVSNNMYDISTGQYRETWPLMLCVDQADNHFKVQRYPFAPWNNIGTDAVRVTNLLDVNDFFLNTMPPDDPYGTDDNHTPVGGYGDYDYSSEQELPSLVPGISANNIGFVSLWNPTVAELKQLADWLWTGSFAINAWRSIFSKPMECILSVGVIPFTPTRYQSGGADTKLEIEFTGTGTNVNSYKITEQFYVLDMGTVHIGGKSNSYMDYSPYTKASIFLPYCGTYALDVDDIMDADVALEYHVDIYTGSCVAYLTISGKFNSDNSQIESVMYQFTGNMLSTIPVTSADHSQFIQSLLIMGASIAATVATSGAGAAAPLEGLAASGDAVAGSAALNAVTAGSAINTVMSMKPNVMHSGNLSSTAGYLGGQRPYITMTWSNLCRPTDEQKLVGMPSHKAGVLSSFTGFTIVSSCHLDNILCTDAERALIEQALAKGVIL